jgi:UDP-3-O-[3-hydroxymyristoyl] glucosamine N-acyltransferase
MSDRQTPPAPLTAEELAAALGGELVNPQPGVNVSGLTSLEEAGPGMASFIVSASHASELEATRASVVLMPASLEPGDKTAIKLDDVWRGVKWTLEYFHPRPAPSESTDPTAVVAGDVKRGKNVRIGPCAVIESGVEIGDNVRIGAGCFIGESARIDSDAELHPNVSVLHDCEIGARVAIFPGTVIGADGYKFEVIDDRPQKVPQIGKVVIEDDVEIGANCAIDRAAFTQTVIGEGTKIDNLVHIAHNCRIGKYCMIVGQVGIAGSTDLGDGCILAGQVGLKDNLKIGNKVVLAAQSGVMHDIPDGQTWFGYPAQPISDTMKQTALIRKLPQLAKDLRELKKKLE